MGSSARGIARRGVCSASGKGSTGTRGTLLGHIERLILYVLSLRETVPALSVSQGLFDR